MALILGLIGGLGAGLALGTLFGTYIAKVGLEVIQTAVEKVTAQVVFPKAPIDPQPILEQITERAFADVEEDDFKIPSWMDDEVS